MSVIHMTTLFNIALVLQGEIWYWSLLVLKGLTSSNKDNSANFSGEKTHDETLRGVYFFYNTRKKTSNQISYSYSFSSSKLRGHLTLEAGREYGDFEKKFPASACRKKKIACSTNVIESLWEKKGKKYPAHQIARKKKFFMTRNPPPPDPEELNGRPLKVSITPLL